MASAKQSAVDTPHKLYTAELTRQLKEGEPNAALLAVIGNFLSRSGTKPVSDSPALQRLMNSYESLPFTTADQKAPN